MTPLRSSGILLALLFAGTLPAFAQTTRTVVSDDGTVRAEAALVPERPTLADNPCLHIDVSCAPTQTVRPPEFGKRYGRFRVAAFRALPETITDGKRTASFLLTLEPTAGGENSLPPIELEIVSDANGESPIRLTLPSASVNISSQSAGASLDALAGARPERFNRFGPLAAALVLCAAILASILYFRRKKQMESLLAVVESPSDRAVRELDELLRSKLHRTDIKLFYLKLTGIVRRFIEETTGLRAPEETTEEFLETLRTKGQKFFDPQMRLDMGRFLEFSDLVKFAKFQPAEQEILEGHQKALTVVRHDFSPEPKGGEA